MRKFPTTNLVSITGLSRRINVDRRTLRALIDLGVVKPQYRAGDSLFFKERSVPELENAVAVYFARRRA